MAVVTSGDKLSLF